MDSAITSALIGLLGISLGAFFSGLGYYLRFQNELLKNKKSVLFYLLEIRNTVRTEYFDPNESSKSFIGYVNSYLKSKGLNDDSAPSEELFAIISAHFENLSKAIKTRINEELVVPFNESLISLSKDDPVLAYKLKGKENISSLLSAQDEYIGNLSNIDAMCSNELLKDVMPQKIQQANESVIKEILDDLSKEIRMVAWKCGLATYVRCVFIVRNNERPEYDFSKSGASEFMDQFLLTISQEACKKSKLDAAVAAPIN